MANIKDLARALGVIYAAPVPHERLVERVIYEKFVMYGCADVIFVVGHVI
jgi:hypothetical protein